MFTLSKQVFFILLSFSGSLASMPNVYNFTKGIYFNNKPYMMTIPTHD